MLTISLFWSKHYCGNMHAYTLRQGNDKNSSKMIDSSEFSTPLTFFLVVIGTEPRTFEASTLPVNYVPNPPTDLKELPAESTLHLFSFATPRIVTFVGSLLKPHKMWFAI